MMRVHYPKLRYEMNKLHCNFNILFTHVIELYICNIFNQVPSNQYCTISFNSGIHLNEACRLSNIERSIHGYLKRMSLIAYIHVMLFFEVTNQYTDLFIFKTNLCI